MIDGSTGLESILQQAKQNDVCFIQSISVEISKAAAIIELASHYHNMIEGLGVGCSVGTHPLYISKEPIAQAQTLIELCQNKRVIGIGETGLDYYRDNDRHSKLKQQQSFCEHIIAAQETQLPLIIHSRNAEEDTVALVRQHLKERPFKALIHCFTASQKMADECLDMGLYLSASGIISFKNARDIQNVFQRAPQDKILIETDSPYLAPSPHRGQQNKPAYVRHVAEHLSQIREESYEAICQATTGNFFKLFSKALSK